MSSDIVRFRNVFYSLCPSWLRAGSRDGDGNSEGEGVLYSLGLMQDIFSDRFRMSLEARFPENCPADALQYLGRDRLILRGINEARGSYEDRLIQWLDAHRTRGNPWSLMDQLFGYLNDADVVLRTVDNAGNWYTRAADGTRSYSLAEGNWDWDGLTSQWARFWVIFDSTNGPWASQWTAPYASTTTATADQIADVKTIVRDWKPAGTQGSWVITSFDPLAFKPGVGWGYTRFLNAAPARVELGNIAALSFGIADTFSIVLWMRCVSPSLGTLGREIFGKRNGLSPKIGWYILADTTDKLRFYLQDGASSFSQVRCNTEVTDGNWHMCVVTYAGNGGGSAAAAVTWYVDGAPASQSTLSDDATGTITNSASVTVAGRDTTYSSGVEADIGGVTVFDRVLTPTEIATAYAQAPYDWSALSPVGWWRLGVGSSATVFVDDSAGGNDGTGVNIDPGAVTSDRPAGGWASWSDGDPRRPVRFRDARYWVGPR